MYSHDAATLLDGAGWTPVRRVDSSRQLAALTTAGYAPGSHVRSVISNLVGLKVNFTSYGRSDSIRLDPGWAIELCFKSWVDEYSSRAQTPLIPMGYANSEHLLLLVAEDGRWFGGYDDEFGYLGNSVLSMVDIVANGRGFQEDQSSR